MSMYNILIFIVLMFQFNPLVKASDVCSSYLSTQINYKDIFRSSKRFNTKNSQASYVILKALANYGTNPLRYSNRVYSYITKFTYPEVDDNLIVVDNLGFDPSRRYLRCGTCSKMFENHFSATVIPLAVALGQVPLSIALSIDPKFKYTAGKFVIIRYKGVNIGAIKLYGSEVYQLSYNGYFSEIRDDIVATSIPNPTFLSFRNVYDSRDRQVLSLAGVYNISLDFFNTVLLSEVNKQGAYYGRSGFYRKFRPLIIDVDEMSLKPETFVLNNEAWDRADRFVQNFFGQIGFSSNSFIQHHRATQKLITSLQDVTESDLKKLGKILDGLPDVDNFFED